MNILHIPTNGLFINGIISCIATYMTEIGGADVQATVLSVDEPAQDAVDLVTRSGCNVVSIPYRKRDPLKYFFALYLYLRKSNFNIIHVHGSSAIMSIELLAAKWAGCRIRIAHSHNVTCDHILADRMLRFLFNRLYTHAFACGQAAGNWLFDKNPYIIIPNARDLKRFEYNEIARKARREELAIPENAWVIGHVGYFNIPKNHKFLIEVFNVIARQDDSARLLLVGEGALLPEIRGLVERFSLSDKVIFAGVSDTVERDLCAMDVFVLPSLYEGLPLVIIEAQASGLPCIISDSVTEECIITELVTRLSLENGTSAWATEVIHVGKATGNCRGKAPKDKLRVDYDIKISAQRLKQLYEEFAGEKE